MPGVFCTDHNNVYVGAYVRTYVKVNKTLSLSYEVAERLDDEQNQSQLVESLLKDHYGMEVEDDD